MHAVHRVSRFAAAHRDSHLTYNDTSELVQPLVEGSANLLPRRNSALEISARYLNVMSLDGTEMCFFSLAAPLQAL